MYLTDESISTKELQEAIALSPYSKPAVALFVMAHKSAKTFLDAQIFLQIRQQIEKLIGAPLNLRKRLDKAKMGRFIAIAELTHRRALPDGVEPLYLLGETTEPEPPQEKPSENGLEMLRYTLQETIEPEPQEKPLENVSEDVEDLKKERDRATAEADRYRQQLREFEEFTQLLLVGRIFAEPPELNGLEEAPLLQVFGSPTTLDQLHHNFKILRAKHHPDSSPYQAQEAADRFIWLKKAYLMLCDNWVRFSPTNSEIPSDRIEKLKAQQLQWEADSFWYWN